MWSFKCAAILCLAFGVAISSSACANTLREQLIGTWTYVSSTAKQSDGSPLWGNEPKGLFIITENGHFSWHMFRSDRPKFSNRLNATPDEYRAAMVGSLAYFGTFNVDEAERTIIFRTVGSTFPHAEGEVIKRVVSRISAEEFTYANPSTTTGAGIEATWRRVK